MVVLDTDHVSFLAHGGSKAASKLRDRLAELSPHDWGTSIVTYAEQSRGWLAYLARARTPADRVDAYAKLSKHLKLYHSIIVLDFDHRAATVFTELARARLKVGTMDLSIAAICLAHDATLLSRNLADFRRVPKLHVEDWTK